MKYLKLFETTIKHSDPISVNHPLRDFSRKVEDVMISIKEIDGFNKSTVRRYFNDNGYIHINYSSYVRGRALKIEMCIVDDEYVRMNIFCYKHFSKDEINTSLEFYNFVKNNMSKYIEQDLGFELHLKFSFSEKDQVLGDLESFAVAKRYNV